MKKILSIALSLLLLVNILPMNTFVRAQENVTPAVANVAIAVVKEYNAPGAQGTQGNPIIMYVGESVRITTPVEDHSKSYWPFGRSTFDTKWKLQDIDGTNVATFDDHSEVTGITPRTTVVKATSLGSIQMKMQYKENVPWSISWNDASEAAPYFYITVIEKPESAGTNQASSMAFTKDAEWVNYNEGIAKITLNATNTQSIQGSDVIIIMDKSSSMSDNSRWATQKTAVNNITTELLNNTNKNNRVAVIAFSGDTKGSFNFKANQQAAINGISNISIMGYFDGNGTNYSLAFQQAINYANSRENSIRPLHIVFMTDGEYTESYNGGSEYSVLKGLSTSTKAMGIDLNYNSNGAKYLRNLFGTPNYMGTKPATINEDIANLLQLIAEKYTSATGAVITDTIKDNFAAVEGNALYPASARVQLPLAGSKDVKVTIGAMEAGKTYTDTYYVKINETDRNTNSNYDTSSNTELKYFVDTLENIKNADIPKLMTKTGSITVNYVIGTSIEDTNTESNLSIRGEAYTRTPVAPRGYKLDGVVAPKEIILTYDNNEQVVNFPVIKLKELHMFYLGMQGFDLVPVVDNNIYFKGEKATVLGSKTITQTIGGKDYYLAGWTGKKALTTDERVLIQTKTEFDTFNFVKFGKKLTLNNDRSLYAVWAPVNINEKFVATFMNEGTTYQPDGYANSPYAYGQKVLAPTNPLKEATDSSTFTFLGWTLGETGEDGQPIIADFSTLMITENLEFTAVYKPIAILYDVRFLNSDGTEISNDSKVYDSIIFNKMVPTIPVSEEKQGYSYEFAGWKNLVTEVIVDVANNETPVFVKGAITFQATYKETARTDMSFRILFVNASNVEIATAFQQDNATFDQTYEITNAMLPTTLTAFVPRTTNPKNIKITNVEENVVRLIYDAVVVPVTPVVIPTPQTPQAQTPVVTPVTPAVRPVVIPTPQTPQAQAPVVTPEEIITPEVVVTPEIVTPETPKADKPSVDIKDEVTPKAESPLSWAFINLVMMILTACASIVLLMTQLLNKKRNMNKTAFIRFFSLLPALVSVIAFFVTENMMNPMILFDKWTLMMVLIAAVQVAVVALSLKKFDAVEENIER